MSKKSILIRMDPKLHKAIKLFSVKTGISINEYVVRFLESIIKNKGEKDE